MYTGPYAPYAHGQAHDELPYRNTHELPATAAPGDGEDRDGDRGKELKARKTQIELAGAQP